MEICDTEGTVEFAACKHLGETRVKQALPTLSEKLTKIEERAARWRKIRDSEREDLADHRPNRTRAFELGRAMARIDPEDTGIKLLSHDLFKVRYGAWMGLGSVGTVDLLRNIHGRRQENGDPLFQYAAYRAIDHILIYLGVQGGVEDLKALEAFYTPEVEAEEGVGTRVEWTIEQIKSRVR